MTTVIQLERARVDIELQSSVENLLARYAHAIGDDQIEAVPDFCVEHARYRSLPLRTISAVCRCRCHDRLYVAGENGRAQLEERIMVSDSRGVDTLIAIPLRLTGYRSKKSIKTITYGGNVARLSRWPWLLAGPPNYLRRPKVLMGVVSYSTMR